MQYSYAELFRELTVNTGIVVFFKKNGDVRVMLCTRNLRTVEIQYGFQGKALGGHDNRCNIGNGNMAVFDLVVGDARSFNIDRVVYAEIVGEVKNKEQLEVAVEKYIEIKEHYKKSTAIGMDSI